MSSHLMKKVAKEKRKKELSDMQMSVETVHRVIQKRNKKNNASKQTEYVKKQRTKKKTGQKWCANKRLCRTNKEEKNTMLYIYLQ